MDKFMAYKKNAVSNKKYRDGWERIFNDNREQIQEIGDEDKDMVIYRNATIKIPKEFFKEEDE